MRASNVLALLCVLFLTCCDGLHTDTHVYLENDKLGINTVGHEENRRLRSTNDADNNEGAMNHGNAASKKHATEDQEPTDTTGRLNEERTNPLSKITSSLSKSKSLPTSSTLSANKLVVNKLAANSKIVGGFKKSSSFQQLYSTLSKKSPTELKNDLAVLQKTTGYKDLEKVMGKDPLKGTAKDFKRVDKLVWKHRYEKVAGRIGAVLVIVVALGLAVGILFGPLIAYFVREK